MQKKIATTSLLIVISSGFGCFAADMVSGLFYDKNSQVIKSSDGVTSIKFDERDEGNSSYYFDYFGGLPSVVHDNNSLDSYSAYSIIDYGKREPGIKCIYLDFKSGSNGINSKEGRCGLDLKGSERLLCSGDEGSGIVNNVIGKINSIDASYLINGKTNYLPIIMFQNKYQYVYKLYEKSEDLKKNSYRIISCDNNSHDCEVYSKDTWVVFNDTAGVNVTLEEIKKLKENSIVDKASPDKKSDSLKKYLPFNIKAPKAYFRSLSGEKLSSYLIQGDKVTLLKIDNSTCSIRYINSKNKSLDGNVACSDLNLYN